MKADDLRALLATATPGPWQWEEGYDTLGPAPAPGTFGPGAGLYSTAGVPVVEGIWRNDSEADCGCDNEADAALIVWLRNHADALADLIDASRQVGIADQNASAMAARLGARDHLARVLAALDDDA